MSLSIVCWNNKNHWHRKHFPLSRTCLALFTIIHTYKAKCTARMGALSVFLDQVLMEKIKLGENLKKQYIVVVE